MIFQVTSFNRHDAVIGGMALVKPHSPQKLPNGQKSLWLHLPESLTNRSLNELGAMFDNLFRLFFETAARRSSDSPGK